MAKLSSIVACFHLAVATSSPTTEVHTSLRQARISPTLDPLSSKKFFGTDYPDDGRPDVKGLKKHGFHDFTPPFPSVQGSDAFDRDYVKDENRDNGEWQAQSHYDRLKLEWRKVKDALEKAKGEEGGKKVDSDALAAKVRDALAKTGAGKVKSEKAAKWRAELQKEEKAAEEKAAANRAAAGNTTKHEIPKGPVEAAQWKLDKEEKDFKKCKEELEAAHEHLKAVQEALEKKKVEQVKKDEADKVKATKDISDADAKVEEKKKAVKDAEAETVADDKVAADADAANAVVQKEADGQKGKYDKDQMTVAEAKANLEKAESDLSKAEHKLKAYRGELPAASANVVPAAPEGSAMFNSVKGMFAKFVARLR